jgi:hypothetical protein
MHTPYRASAGSIAVIDLNDGFVPAGGTEFLGAKKARQEPARITQSLALDAFESCQWQVGD